MRVTTSAGGSIVLHKTAVGDAPKVAMEWGVAAQLSVSFTDGRAEVERPRTSAHLDTGSVAPRTAQSALHWVKLTAANQEGGVIKHVHCTLGCSLQQCAALADAFLRCSAKATSHPAHVTVSPLHTASAAATASAQPTPLQRVADETAAAATAARAAAAAAETARAVADAQLAAALASHAEEVAALRRDVAASATALAASEARLREVSAARDAAVKAESSVRAARDAAAAQRDSSDRRSDAAATEASSLRSRLVAAEAEAARAAELQRAMGDMQATCAAEAAARASAEANVTSANEAMRALESELAEARHACAAANAISLGVESAVAKERGLREAAEAALAVALRDVEAERSLRAAAESSHLSALDAHSRDREAAAAVRADAERASAASTRALAEARAQVRRDAVGGCCSAEATESACVTRLRSLLSPLTPRRLPNSRLWYGTQRPPARPSYTRSASSATSRLTHCTTRGATCGASRPRTLPSSPLPGQRLRGNDRRQRLGTETSSKQRAGRTRRNWC